MSLLPSRGPDTSTSQDGELQVVGVDEDVSAVLDALSSETAREILNTVYEEPGTPSELADRLDMSIQKVSYHLEKLEDEELIAVAGVQYSEKGQEMKVYEPPEDPLVLFVGTQERKRSLRSLVRRVLPVVGILTAASVMLQLLLGQFPIQFGSSGAGSGAGTAGDGGQGSRDAESLDAANQTAATADPTPTPTASDDSGFQIAEVTETPETTPAPEATPVPEATPASKADTPAEMMTEQARQLTTDAAASGGFELAPGVAFFLGGLLVLTLYVSVWAYRNYR
ncbi:winged helix-turn-helix transcriptional regulator [Haloarcula sp. CBA1130]|uniref:winged helix-turn-helix domain-containing protein n=1 Tax=unclassified Haloarcula TaxID=2624677 RepID=UPI00124686C4|nr:MULTISPECIES: winged helix-turn-helix domain-containing protein [unclassified Haloarcula]KAA9397803.1 winged helix-turn-helix transcriptional regulator [Haloarcula sp. CBA1129]KAA9402510.1 winged helix-turn-helix transcriptional regulator [Haloarcula sp. CBA1130]